MKEEIFITKSFEETRKVGEDFAEQILDSKSPFVVALFGDLGSGKTTFMQGFAKGLGVEKRIISPTFIVVRKYEIKIKNFYHIDLYRMENQEDIEGLGIDEIMSNPENIVAIEWAEKMGELLPKNRWDLRFEYIDENKRKIVIRKME